MMKWAWIEREKWYRGNFVMTKVYKYWWTGGRKLLHNYEIYEESEPIWNWKNVKKAMNIYTNDV